MKKYLTILFLMCSVCINAQSLYSSAVELYESEKYEEAIPIFKEHLNTLEDFGDIIVVEEYIASCFFRIEDYERALKWTDKILKKHPINQMSLIINLNIGVSNNDNELVYNATNILIEELSVDEFYAFYHRGIANMILGKYELGLNDLLNAYEKDPLDKKLIYYLGLANFELKNYDEAIDYFSKSVDQGFKVEESYFDIAGSYFNTKNFEKALAVYKIIKDKYPDYYNDKLKDLDFLYALGECYYKFGEYSKAIYYLEQIYDEEFDYYERTLKITVLSYNELSETYSQKEEHEKAAYFIARKAQYFLKRGYFDLALEVIEEAIEIDPTIHYTLYRAQVMMVKLAMKLSKNTFENEQKKHDFYEQTKNVVLKVYGDIFEIDPEQELYLKRYVDDLIFLFQITAENDVLDELCSTYDKLEELGYKFNPVGKQLLCDDTKEVEKTKFEYELVLFDLESFEKRFGEKNNVK